MSETEGSQFVSPVTKESADLLSNLADDAKLKILECLPLKDAVRTSILSTTWRYKWAKISQIILDGDALFKHVPEGSYDVTIAYSKIVNNVLLSHIGPLRKFKLHIPFWFKDDSFVCQWLQFISRKDVSELTLFDSRFISAKLPSALFSYAGLTTLTLHNCKFSTLPQKFTGFPFLSCLVLFRCSLQSPLLIERIISSCPQLRVLHLEDIREVPTLNIESPKLKYLYAGSNFLQLCIGSNTTQLTTLKLDFRGIHQRLTFNPLSYLQCVELIDIPLHCHFLNYFALKMLHSFHVLQRLHCRVSERNCCRCEITPNMSSRSFSNIGNGNLPSLKSVELVHISGSYNEVQFIKHILECAPVLEAMTVKLSEKVNDGEDKFKIAVKLIQFTRASTNAQIIIKT